MVQDVKVKVGNADLDPIEEFDVPVYKVGKGGVFGPILGAVKVEYDLVTLPLNLFPAKSRRLAKQTTLDFFKTVRSFIDDINDGLEKILVTNLEKD